MRLLHIIIKEILFHDCLTPKPKSREVYDISFLPHPYPLKILLGERKTQISKTGVWYFFKKGNKLQCQNKEKKIPIYSFGKTLFYHTRHETMFHKTFLTSCTEFYCLKKFLKYQVPMTYCPKYQIFKNNVGTFYLLIALWKCGNDGIR